MAAVHVRYLGVPNVHEHQPVVVEVERFGYCVPDAGTYVPESGTPLPFPNVLDVLLAQICVRKVTALATRSAKRKSRKRKA